MATTNNAEKPKTPPATPAPDSHERTEQEERLHRRKDELLDQGVEETFPASDPVAVKHIT